MNPIVEKVYQIGIIPVIAFNSVDEALPLCKALADGGLPAAEVTFRTACAEECIRKIHEEMPEMLLGAGTVLTTEQADRAMAAGASFIVAPGFDPEVCKHVIDKGGIMMPGTCSAGEMQQAMNMGCEALKFFPAEANGGVGMLKNIGAALKSARWMCTGGVNAKNVNDYLGYDQIFAVGGTWMCKSDVIKAGDWAKITAQSKEAVDTMLGLKLLHVGINTGNEEEAMKVANLIGAMLNMKVAPGFDPEVCKHVIDKGGIMMPGTASAGEMQQAMNMGCEALKFFPAEANGGVGMLKNIGAALKGARWMCTGGVNAKNVNDYLGYDQIFAVGGTWMCKSDVIKAGDWAKITAQSKEAVDTMLGLHLIHVGINTGNEEEAAKIAGLISTMLNMKVTPGNSSIFVGNKEFEIMKKPGRGTNGHIAIGCNNVDRAIYHLSQRGVKFDLDSKNVKNGKTVACYMEGEIAGFAFHLVQA